MVALQAQVGFNFIRVFLHNLPFESNNYDFHNIERLIELAHEAGIVVLLQVTFLAILDL
jgi:hypothetical protein